MEDYSPMLIDGENETETDHSMKYKYKQETNDIVEKCFDNISKIDMSGLSDEELIEKIQKEIEAQTKLNSNPYFKMLVSK